MLLLDTNIVSYFFKEHRIVKSYFPILLGRDAAISFQSKAEMEAGSLVAKWSSRRQLQLDTFLSQYKVLHSDDDICFWWAHIQFQRKSQPISVGDAWIAATAMSYDLELVTHNPKDFQGIPNLRIITAAP